MIAIRTLLLALLVLVPALPPAAAQERILNFVSDVTVERNGDLLVTETIRVQAEGRQIRRGIFRDFPTTYSRPDGSHVEVGFHVDTVTRDGKDEHWILQGQSNGVRVLIGNADVTIATGPHEYVIRYRATRQIGFYPDFDELYWNATGNGWDFAIDQAEARITLPEQVPFRQNAFYTGPQGAQGKDATVVEQRPGRIVFRTTRPLPPHNGLTVAAGWQKGLIEPPTTTQQARYWMEDNAALAVAIVGIALLLAYYALAWSKVGRDPPSGVIIPLFGPPAGMSPAATRYVDRMGFDDRCFAASIINLGVNGHLKIDGSGKKPTLQHHGGGHAVAAEEQNLEGALFAAGDAITLVQTNHVTLGNAKTALKDALTCEYLGKLFRNNYLWSGFGLALALLMFIAILTAAVMVNRTDVLAGLVAGGVFTFPFVMGGAVMMFKGWQRHTGGTWLMIGGAIVLLLAVGIGFSVVSSYAPGTANLIPAAAIFIAAAISGIGFSWLKAPTAVGRKTMDDIEGFRQYLGVAEEDRLNAMNPPDKTPELFEHFLPYAVALDVQNAWAKKFAGVLAAAGAAAVANSWYYGDRRWHNDPVAFADHLGSELTQTISSASTAPGSSSSGGSSGGGSSGGGGGGGGGGGW
jgi:uncharacterized membrane protein YgcG